MGTDHHQFDRLTGWLEAWLQRRPMVRCLHQHGSSRPIAGAQARALLPRDELLDLMRNTDIVVAQGGPGSIMDARSCGRIPIVVPRVPELDEVVDHHQVAFCRHLDMLGWIRLAETEAGLSAVLDEAVLTPTALHIQPEHRSVEEASARLAHRLDDVMAHRAGGIDVRRLRYALTVLRHHRVPIND